MNAFPTCPWCQKPVFPGDPRVPRDGDTFHLWCAAEEDDDAMFDRDMEFGS